MKVSMKRQSGKILGKIEYASTTEAERFFRVLLDRPATLRSFDHSVAEHLDNWTPNSGSNVFEYLFSNEEINELNSYLHARRGMAETMQLSSLFSQAFAMIGPEVKDISDYRSWRSQGPDECPCGTRREVCVYHR